MDKAKEKQMLEETNGQNLKKFSQAFFRFGAILPPDHEGARISFGSSVELGFGFRKKYKATSFYSLGWEMDVNWMDYKLKQTAAKSFPDSTLHKRERLDVSSLGIGMFHRFNFDPGRGNTIGKYVELAIRGQYTYYELMRKNDLPDGSNAKTVITGLPYTLPFQSTLSARIGFGHLVFYTTYRFTGLLKSRYNYPDLPAMTAGVEIGIY
jgi:hypothetical protein